MENFSYRLEAIEKRAKLWALAEKNTVRNKEGLTVEVVEVWESRLFMDKTYWFNKAKEASAIIGWFPTVILAQWQLETGNFKSSNFINNNNIAGQTWQVYMPLSMRGTSRPANEGGYYIKYDDPVIGYVDFIQKNPRYKNVKNMSTEEAQIREIANQGWAVDKEYADKLINILNLNKNQGYVLEDDEMKLDDNVSDFILSVLGYYWNVMEENKDIQDYTHYCANELRKAVGREEE